MRMRLITVWMTALALLATAPYAASAQDPSPTATPTGTPSASSADAKTDWPKDVQRVYDDYRRDGVVDVCTHTQKTLQDTLDTIEPAYDQDYPDFREAIKAGIERHKAGRCTDAATPTPTATPTTGAGASGTSTPAPSATADSGAGAESGKLPASEGAKAGDGATPPADQVPPASTPAPAATVPPVAPAAAAVAATPAPPAIVRTAHRSLAVPAILIAIALLGAAALGLWALAARRSPRFAHAWREAAFRTRGTWADFSDWLRLGR